PTAPRSPGRTSRPSLRSALPTSGRRTSGGRRSPRAPRRAGSPSSCRAPWCPRRLRSRGPSPRPTAGASRRRRPVSALLVLRELVDAALVAGVAGEGLGDEGLDHGDGVVDGVLASAERQ